MQNVKKGFFIFWQIPITLGTIENLNLSGIFCVSISLQNAEALAETGGFPSNFRSYTRMFAQWRSRPLFQCRYNITETHAQALFLFPLVSRALVVTDDIREKKIETTSMFSCMAPRSASLDEIWLWRKKALLSQNLLCIIMIQCSSISSFLT